MRILAVDTSSERGSVCVVDSGEVLGEIRLASSIQHSDRLFPSIGFLLEYLPFQLSDVDIFAAALGPGSFTGLRVGLAAIEGFAAAHCSRGAGVTTLEALAWKTRIRDALIAPTIDARRGEVYGALYRRTGDTLVEEHPAVVLKPAEWFFFACGAAGFLRRRCGPVPGGHRRKGGVGRSPDAWLSGFNDRGIGGYSKLQAVEASLRAQNGRGDCS